jgi:hypothetical protein
MQQRAAIGNRILAGNAAFARKDPQKWAKILRTVSASCRVEVLHAPQSAPARIAFT